MKKKDLILALSFLLIAGILLLVYRFALPIQEDNASLQITVNGDIYGTYSLDENQRISIQDTNECQIQDGVVTMIDASCPDHLCEQQKAIDARGGTIVCLPNRVVLSIVSDTKTQIDAISQ